ncbi:class I SAM-dependent methyltransferase [candidate division KSB1 bacterium]|nr:class I SAM-dependent methyltransferase [candidate division KSB1 bacterium]
MSNKIKKVLLLEDQICPWWLAYTFDHSLRRLIQNPEKILKPYVRKGMTVIDIGCGMGFFSIAMAKMVGENGKVISVDLQQEMLDVLGKRAEHANIPNNIVKQKCDQSHININQQVDFILTFWMLHEVPEKMNFLKQIFEIIKPAGQFLIVEPKIHTGKTYFNEIVNNCKQLGFLEHCRPKIFMSRAVVFIK